MKSLEIGLSMVFFWTVVVFCILKLVSSSMCLYEVPMLEEILDFWRDG